MLGIEIQTKNLIIELKSYIERVTCSMCQQRKLKKIMRNNLKNRYLLIELIKDVFYKKLFIKMNHF